MSEHVIIDGNNLLHAMHEHAPLPHVGRETLVRVIERWAHKRDGPVTLVFDGAVPRGGLSRQMSSKRVAVRFSAPVTADDVIVEMIQKAGRPDEIRIVTSDNAIRREARARKCNHAYAAEFIDELFASDGGQEAPRRPADRPEKPPDLSPEEAREWLDLFGTDDDEPFDGYGAMQS